MMKKFYISVICATLFCACNTKDNVQVYNNVNDEPQINQLLYNLGQKYEVSTNKKGYYRAPEKESEKKSEYELTKEDKIRIAKADAEGLAVGAGVGGATGATIGSLCPGVGTAVGGLAGGSVFGVAYATLFSVNEKNEILAEHENDDVAYPYSINTDTPINDFTDPSPLFDTNIRFANTGLVHNVIISQLYNQDPEHFLELTNSELIEFICNDFFYPIEGSEDDYSSLCDELRNIDDDFISSHKDNISTNGYDEFLQYYLEAIRDIPEKDWIAYSEDFMRIMSDYLEDEIRLITINGYISTFIYSKCLWNLNMPSEYSGNYLMLNVMNESWEYTQTYNIDNIYNTLAATGTPVTILVPFIQGNQLKSLFLFNNLSMINFIPENPVISYDSNTIEMHLTESVEIEIEDKLFSIPSGEYTFSRFNEGYFVDIN